MGNEDLYVFVSQLIARFFGKEMAIDFINRALISKQRRNE
jgi:hypothetical protein